jgi:hypothetical protein
MADLPIDLDHISTTAFGDRSMPWWPREGLGGLDFSLGHHHLREANEIDRPSPAGTVDPVLH